MLMLILVFKDCFRLIRVVNG